MQIFVCRTVIPILAVGRKITISLPIRKGDIMASSKKNGRLFLTLVIFCLTGQVAWTVENMYFNVFVYK